MRNRFYSIRLALAAVCALAPLTPARALVYCVTNPVDPHQSAPAGELADSGWAQTAPIGDFLGTVIHSNVLLTAEHLKFKVGRTFTYEEQSRLVTAVATNAGHDLAVLFFAPAATGRVALINIETNDIDAEVVLQGRGMERGDVVITDGRTNGWKWAWNQWLSIRRWGKNRYCGEAENGLLAVATFDNNGDPDECMLSPGDSGGPGFIRTGSGWKLATVNYSVDPDLFRVSTNSGSSFQASLYDCAGLYYYDYFTSAWRYVPPEASPAPCIMLNTRTAACLAWLTNTVAALTFPADIGLSWRCETNLPSASRAVQGLWFEVVATNAGPYTARDLAIDVSWGEGLRLRGHEATAGAFETNRWTLPELPDGHAATLHVDTVVWLSQGRWATNHAAVAGSDKPDGVSSNDAAECIIRLPSTATRFLID